MNRLVLPLLFLAMACSLASASGRGEARRKSIVMVVPAGETSVADSTRAGIAAFATEHPEVTATVTTTPAGDPDAQVKAVRDLVASGVGALLVAPVDPPSLLAAFRSAKEAGVIVLTTGDPRQTQASCDVEAFDDTEYGRHTMDVMATWMGYSGSWQPFISQRDSPAEHRWVDGELTEARAAYPGVTAVDRAEVPGDEQAVHDSVVQLLASHPELKAIMGSSAAVVRGAARAVTEAGRIGTVGVFGNCVPSAAADYIRSGAVIAVTFSVPADLAYVTARAADEQLGGRPVSSGQDLGRPGYNRVRVRPNESGVPVIYGTAWMTVNRDNLKDWVAADGSFKL